MESEGATSDVVNIVLPVDSSCVAVTPSLGDSVVVIDSNATVDSSIVDDTMIIELLDSFV